MINISKLIIACITFIIFVCAAIYLYNKNTNHITKDANGVIEKFQGTTLQNPIIIADMATTITDNSAKNEYAIFKMIGSLADVILTKKYPLYSKTSYNASTIKYPTNIINSTSISIDNDTGKITLSPTKKYKIHFTFTKQHFKILGTTATYTDLDATIESYDNFNKLLPTQTYTNSAQVIKNVSISLANSLVTLNIYAIITNVSYIIPVIQYKNATLASSTYSDTSSYMLIEII